MDFETTAVVLLSILQVTGAIPPGLSGEDYNDLIEMKKTLASLEALERKKQELKEAEEDISSIVSKANQADSDKAVIRTALKELMTLSCLEFVDRTTEKDYLKFNSGKGCWSSIGRTGGGQMVSLARGSCLSNGVIHHEVIHSLGFYHEQNRSDRDKYVDIIYQYLNPGDFGNFNITDSDNLGLPYDYSSVMHYGRYYSSIKAGKETIIPKPDPTAKIGQRYGVSTLDVTKLNKFYNCNLCRSVLTGTKGILTSINYHSPYRNESSCVWLIRIESGKVFLQFIAFYVQTSKNCSSEYIKVYDGANSTSPVLLYKACVTGPLTSLLASGNAMLVEFVRDTAVTGAGFKASYSTVKCGGTFPSDNGIVTSPGYPKKYPNSMDCIFLILAPVGYKIKMTFTNFKLEYASNCFQSNDYLVVYDGSRLTAPKLGTFCSNRQIPPPVFSTENSMLLNFYSDVSGSHEGFRATYSFELGQTQLEPSLNSSSNPLDITCIVLQGSIFGHLLFAMVINDLPTAYIFTL